VNVPLRQPRTGEEVNGPCIGSGLDRNVLGGWLERCGTDPLTGFYRDGGRSSGTSPAHHLRTTHDEDDPRLSCAEWQTARDAKRRRGARTSLTGAESVGSVSL
jgi:uncharacterized protein (DUF2237 family)